MSTKNLSYSTYSPWIFVADAMDLKNMLAPALLCKPSTAPVLNSARVTVGAGSVTNINFVVKSHVTGPEVTKVT